MQNNSRRDFIIKLSSVTATLASGGILSACGSDSDPMVNFNYGVASGDPSLDGMVLWTYARYADASLMNNSVPLKYELATDNAFTNVVKSGDANASPATGFTVKINLSGLKPGAEYFYRFTSGFFKSGVGKTRTLPSMDAKQVKLAVFSCTLYSAGFFNAYAEAAKSDAQFAIHLGDYIYEYGSEPSKYGNTDLLNKTSASAMSRVALPANDIVSLDDYRTRYAQYRSDPNLQVLHASMPWITVWDDHEFANNAFMTGAENHNPKTQGDWTTRKNNAAQAYHEWLPNRNDPLDATNRFKIYRRFDFANILSLHMLDTRIEGRVQQYANYGTAVSVADYQPYISGLTTGSDINRTMISATQLDWLQKGFAASTAKWQVLGNQDIMAKIWWPANVLASLGAVYFNPSAANQAAFSQSVTDYLTAKMTQSLGGSLTATQTSLLDPTANPKLPYNLDAWDGYPLNRELVLQSVQALNKPLIALSGDSHNAWFAQLTTLKGQKVGVEFAGSSVTSPGFESLGLASIAPALDGSINSKQWIDGNGKNFGMIDDLNFIDTKSRGYLMMTFTLDNVKGEYIYLDTVVSNTYKSSIGKTIIVTPDLKATYS
jgi:alkaline phosphatase D